VDSGHDLAPDIFMVRSTFCVGTELLVQVISGPDTCCIIRSESHKPDIVVAGGSTTLAGAGHILQFGAGTGGTRAGAWSCELPVSDHGILQGVSQKEGSRIL